MKLKLKKNYKYILLSVILILINIFWCLEFNNLTKKQEIIIILTSLIIEICFIVGIYYANKKNIKIENQYLFFGGILGLLFLIIIPMSRIPDEFNHFLRSYEISEGHILSKQDKNTKQGGNKLPENIEKINSLNYRDVKENLYIKKSSKNEFIAFSNTALYAPVCYLPQTIGILIGKLCNTSLMIQAYLGRLINFIVFMTIMYFSIKILPFKKELLFLIGMLPITIQEGVSLSPDALTIAMSTLLISFVMHMKYSKKNLLNKREKIILIILPIVLAMCKIVYLPICLLLFLIPKERFGSLKKKNIFIILLAIITIIINLMWTMKASIFLEANLHGSNSHDQIQFIINNPLNYIIILLRTISMNADLYIFNMLGRNLSYFNIDMYSPYIYINLILLILSTLGNEKNVKKVDNISRYLMIFCFISTILLIFTSIYIQWSPYMLNYIDGVQGRYFIPIIILLGLILSSLFKFDIKETLINKYVILFLCFENIMALISYIGTYIL